MRIEALSGEYYLLECLDFRGHIMDVQATDCVAIFHDPSRMENCSFDRCLMLEQKPDGQIVPFAFPAAGGMVHAGDPGWSNEKIEFLQQLAGFDFPTSG